MSDREKYKKRFKEFTGDVKAFFKRPAGDSDKASTWSGSPPSASSHTNAPAPVGQDGSSREGVTLAPSQAQVPSTSHLAQSDSLDEAVSNEQATSTLQALELTTGGWSTSHPTTNAPQTGETLGPEKKAKGNTREGPAKRGLQMLATGFAGSAVDALRLGPLQDISDMLQGFADMYHLEGSVKKQYEQLQQRLQALLKVLESHSDGSISPAMASKIREIRNFIQGQVDAVATNRSGKQHGKLLMAGDQEERFTASCSRIQEYMDQLSLNTSLTMWKVEYQQSQERMAFLIGSLPSSLSACYDSRAGQELKRRECTPGTRINVLATLHQWASSSGGTGGVYWLNGMAGTGKTTIAYSVCKALDTDMKLGASFFCSRLRQECRSVNMIIPTIAHQLAQFSPSFRSALSTALKKEPDAHTKRLDVQFKTLIEEPVFSAKPALPEGLVVVIDALDECDNEDSTRDILDVLLSKAEGIPIKFIVSSRPEQQIRHHMSNTRVRSRLVLHELDTGEVQTDIETYFRQELKPMKPPPTDAQIAALVKKAGILFIYAATAVRYIGYKSFGRNPTSRLHVILGSSQTERTKHHEEVDQLYRLILKAALEDQELDEDEKDDMRQVLYTVICTREPLTVHSLSELLEMRDDGRVEAALQPLYSVLHVVGEKRLVTTLHASFPDFMFDMNRSGSFCCDSLIHHRKLAEHCFELIGHTKPQFNICGLESSYVPDIKVPDIRKRVASAISSELLYACRYWVEHVKTADCASGVAEQIRDFVSSQLLLWMEVLNLTNQMKVGIECVKLIVEWCKTLEGHQELAELAQDAKRFVEAFASNPVSQSTPHIYVSMLAFWPKSSPIAKHYAKYIQGPVEAEGTALERRQVAHLSTWAFENGIDAMAVSPDGLYLALAISNEVLIVDSYSGMLVLGPLQGHSNMVRSVTFSPDGLRVLAGSPNGYSDQDATILGWDTRTGDAVLGPLQLNGHLGYTPCLSFSPDCSRIATSSHDRTARLWDTRTGKALHELRVQMGVWAIAFSPDGTRVAATFGDDFEFCGLQIWGSHDGETILGPITDINMHKINMIGLSPDNTHIICAYTYGDTILIGDIQGDGIIFRQIAKHSGFINCIGFSSDGKHVVSGSFDRAVRVWDVQSGSMVLGPLEGHKGIIRSVAFSSEDLRIISSCEAGLVCTWNAKQHFLAPSSTCQPSNRITCVKFFSDGLHFASGSEEGTISTWDAHTGEMVLGPIEAHSSRIRAVDVKVHHVVSGSDDGKICVCDARSGEIVLGPLEVGSEAIRAVAYSPNGELFATGSSNRIDVWNARDGSRVLGLLTDLNSTVSSIQFSPDGTCIVASGGSSSLIVVWNLSDGTRVFGTLDGHQWPVNSVSYSSDGALLASGSGDYKVILWDAYTVKRVIGPLTGHSYSVNSVSFSPDSTRLASGSSDKTIRIWDVQTGKMVFEIAHGHGEDITSVEYSPDGTRIMSRSADMSVRIHDARSHEKRVRSRSESEVGDWTIDKDGWVLDDGSKLLVWVPGDLRKALMWPRTQVIVAPSGYVRLNFHKSRMGDPWAQIYTSHM